MAVVLATSCLLIISIVLLFFKKYFSSLSNGDLSKVPTLKSYPFIGHSYLFFPGGKYSADRLTEAILDISRKLGDIFLLNLGGNRIFITLNPDHTQLLFKHEGCQPKRPSFPALLHFRKEFMNSPGVVPSNGPEWFKLRQGVAPLLKNYVINPYQEAQRDVAKSFVEYVRRNRDEAFILTDVYEHLLKFSIEAISVISPGKGIRCLSDDDNDNKEQTEMIMKASIDFMDGLYRTFSEPPIWKLFKTTGYKKLESSHKALYNTVKETIETIQSEYSCNPDGFQKDHPYLWNLIDNSQLSKDDKITLALEVFLGGIDATATTLAFTCFYLATNKKAQETAKNGDWLFLRACIRETLRLSPTAGANARFLDSDAQMGQYLVPKGTLVMSFNSALSRNEKCFEKADEYMPERWLKDSTLNLHKFASLPFGHGPRMCPGRKVAENEMIILLQQLLENFNLESSQAEIGMVFRMNRIPDRKINIAFFNRNV